ncbi:type VII secretion protein EccE [Streptomyces zagrosensis]|uniref:Type VII secretion protein EccE n=1 Tax=Streptomyces zagrosensis TaxID=1042984 RepID=A0A7W9QGU6_9ACTN|nr:type VII secretion protein EccE [Streptomyces zagrosensis]MBB5940031.1 type VII secretion protein EccE [Streptomyces zagrosensis]
MTGSAVAGGAAGAGTTTAGTPGQGPSAPAGPRAAPTAVPRTAARTGGFSAFPLRQLVLVEVAAAVLLIAWVADTLLLAPAAAIAAALVLLALVRRRRRSLPEWLATALALRRRVRRAAADRVPVGTDPGLVPVLECEPALRTYSFTGRARRDVGMIGDGTFLTAVLRLEAADHGLRPPGGERSLPLGLLRDGMDVDGIRLESAQVVQHTQPAPAPHLPQQAVAIRNYAPLQALTGAPALRVTWIALKLDPELCPEAVAARGGGLSGSQRCLLRAADQLASQLIGAGFRAAVLSEGELIAAVAAAACANPIVAATSDVSGTPARRTVETSRTWRCDDRRHTTYWVGRWPQLGASATPLPRLVSLLTAVPVLATTFSLTLSRGGNQESVISGHVRLTGRSDDELVNARRELERTAREAKAGLIRLDREQVPGVLATLPLGGTR